MLSVNCVGCQCTGAYNISEAVIKDFFHFDLDGGYSDWSEWGTCDRSCGGGAQVRTRICNKPIPSGGGKMCHSLGPAIQVRRCNRRGCPGTVLCGFSINNNENYTRAAKRPDVI